MNITKGYLYFIKDLYFLKVDDSELLTNKDNGNKRPSYYCFEDNNNNNLIWFIPISSKVEKYKNIVEHKKQKQLQKNPKKIPTIDTIDFALIGRDERAFLIQNMFPTTKKYIIAEYKRNNIPISIDTASKDRINKKAEKILNLVKKGYKNLVFPDIMNIKTIMEQDLYKEHIIKDFFSNVNSTKYNIDDIIDVFDNCFVIEEVEDFINIINTIDPNTAKDLYNIVQNNTELDTIKNNIKNYFNPPYINHTSEVEEDSESEDDEDYEI